MNQSSRLVNEKTKFDKHFFTIFLLQAHTEETRLEQSLLVGVEVVNTSLHLSTGGAHLSTETTISTLLVQISHAVHTQILESMADTLDEVGNVLAQRTLVHDGANHSLGDTHSGVRAGEVSLGRSVLHGLDGSHTTVLLQADTITVEILTGSLLSSSEHASHHDSASTQAEGLGDVTDITNTSIGNHGDTELSAVLGEEVDSRTLSTTDSAHLLGGADGAHTHTNTDTVHTSINEMLALAHSDHVSTNHIDLREGGLQPADHLQLVHGISLRGVHHNDIHSSVDQSGGTVLIVGASTNGGRAEQAALGVSHGVGVLAVLEQVSARHESDDVALLVHHGQLSDLALAEDLHSLSRVHGVSDGLDVLGGHDLADLGVHVLDEIEVTVGDDAQKLLTQLSVGGDGESAEAVLVLNLEAVSNGVLGGQDSGVENDTIAVHLDELDLMGLSLDGAVVVDYTNTSMLSHSNSHAVLSHSIHARTDHGDVQLDVLAEAAAQVHLISREVDKA